MGTALTRVPPRNDHWYAYSHKASEIKFFLLYKSSRIRNPLV
jgi:hypothetical protein